MQVSRGTVYLRGGTWTIGYTVGGRRVREAIGTNRQMAEAVLKKRIVQALEGRHFDVRNEGRIPFSEFAATYTERCISILKSVKTEHDRVQFWVREFGNRPLGQITRAELQDWQARKRQTCKPATVNRIMCRLRHMFNRAVDWELLDQSPMRGIKFLPENNARLRYLSREECDRLVESCIAPHIRAIVTVAPYRDALRRDSKPAVEGFGLRLGLHHYSRLEEWRAPTRPDGFHGRRSLSQLSANSRIAIRVHQCCRREIGMGSARLSQGLSARRSFRPALP
jgi:hypothetical protein